MAIYHFSGTVISRSQGRSAVACAAYRSGERLTDIRYDTVHDYSRKEDIVHTEVLLPEDAPELMADREQLWNAVEASEKRKDAQLAREFNFALPRELNLQQNLELARAFVQEQFVSQGMVADLCLHEDMQESESLLHAHVMLTLRELSHDGFGYKVRDWNSKEQLLNWREAWANTVNHHLALNGYDLQIDHRTLEAQGIDLEPQYKIGALDAQSRMARLEDHQRIARENGEKLLANPDIALKALTYQQSTFSYQDLARFVNRQTVDAAQFELVYEKIKTDSNIVHLGLDERGIERFTSREMLAIETQMLERTRLLSKCDGHFVKVQDSLQAIAPRTLSTEQTAAFHYLLEPYDLRSVIGYAGTGKSYLLSAVREAFEASNYRVQGITLSGIAAQNLEGSSGIESRTLASRSWYWDRGEQLPGRRDILVVDEAGMLGSRQMARILAVADQGNAKVVLVGDTQQLQAIEAGAAFRAIIEQTGALELTEVRRQRIPWQREATKDFARGHTAKALSAYEAHHVHVFENQALARSAVIEMWNDARLSNPDQTQIMLAYTRVDVQSLNDEARCLRHVQGELGMELAFKTERGQRLFAENDRVYFLKNDKTLGVNNGTLGTIESVKESQIVVRLDEGDIKDINDDRRVIVDPDLYKHLEHGYAATVYKTQGVTVDRAYLLASRHLDAHSTYVGMSRHRESVDLFWSKEVFPRMDALVQTLSRQRGKDVSTDYQLQADFASVRGVEPAEPEQHKFTGLSAFKAQFEADYPAQAKALTATLGRPEDQASHLNKIRDSLGLSEPPNLNLQAFKEKFERENPERAAQLRYELLPAHEKEAIAYEKQQKDEALKLEKALEQQKVAENTQKTLERQKELERSRDDFELSL